MVVGGGGRGPFIRKRKVGRGGGGTAVLALSR